MLPAAGDHRAAALQVHKQLGLAKYGPRQRDAYFPLLSFEKMWKLTFILIGTWPYIHLQAIGTIVWFAIPRHLLLGTYCHVPGLCVTKKTGFGFYYRIYWAFIQLVTTVHKSLSDRLSSLMSQSQSHIATDGQSVSLGVEVFTTV
jgi:hypothetical protein